MWPNHAPMKWVWMLPFLMAVTVDRILAADEAVPDFSRDVRPILAGHCFKCHGPDAAKREAKMRLDVRDFALAVTESGVRPIVPGDPQASELVRRVFSEDSDEMMPPPAAKRPLSENQEASAPAMGYRRSPVRASLGIRRTSPGGTNRCSSGRLAAQSDRFLRAGPDGR